MTQGKHTPGPWVQSGDACIVGPDRKDVAYLTRNTMPNPELRANARLIAAAPNMLEALQATLDELLCVRDYVDDASRGQLRYRGESGLSEMAGSDLVRIDEAIAAARAAIARATGEKP